MTTDGTIAAAFAVGRVYDLANEAICREPRMNHRIIPGSDPVLLSCSAVLLDSGFLLSVNVHGKGIL